MNSGHNLKKRQVGIEIGEDINEEQQNLVKSPSIDKQNNNNSFNNSSQSKKLNILSPDNSDNEDSDPEEKYKNKKKQQLEYQHTFYFTLAKFLYSIIAIITAFCLFIYYINGECTVEEFKLDDDCIDGFLIPYISVWIKVILLSGFLLNSVICMGYYKQINKIIMYITIALYVYLVFFKYDIDPNHITLRDVRGAHALFLGGVSLIFWIIVFIFQIYQNMYKKSKLLFIGFISFQIIVYFLVNHHLNQSCQGWEEGIADQIDFGGQYCKIDKPQVCWPDIVDNWLNFSSSTCEISDKQKYQTQIKLLQEYNKITANVNQDNEEKIKSIMKENQFLSWPLTKDFTKENRKPKNLQNEIIKNTKPVKSIEQGFENGAEVVIDVNNLDLHINVKRDEKLVLNRESVMKQHNGLSKNIIVVYIDTVSRRQMHRKMPKTLEFLKRYIKKDYDQPPYESQDESGKKYKKNKTSFEFFRYHSIDNKTFDNLFQMHYGYQKAYVIKAVKKLIHEFDANRPKKALFNDFKDQGYIVAHAMNTCSCKCIFRGFTARTTSFFADEPADHELMILDPLYINKKNYFDTQMGVNSIYRRCLYGKDTNEHAFEYGKQFLNQYKEEKKVLYLEFTDGHEITSEVVQFIDEPLYNFFIDIENDGHLEQDTMVYILSDHGQHLISAFYLVGQLQGKQTDQINDVFQIERMLPMFYIIATNDVLQKYPVIAQNIIDNSQSIFGMGEIRETLLQNAQGLEQRKQIKLNEKQEQQKQIQIHNETIRKEKEKNPKKKTGKLQFIGIDFEYSLFNQLEKSRSCHDIGMVKFNDPQKFCSCKSIKSDESDGENNYTINEQGQMVDKKGNIIKSDEDIIKEERKNQSNN